jgi:hypothetical protein
MSSDTRTKNHVHERASKKGKLFKDGPHWKGGQTRYWLGQLPDQVDSTDLPEDQSIHKDAAFLATSSIWGKFRSKTGHISSHSLNHP